MRFWDFSSCIWQEPIGRDPQFTLCLVHEVLASCLFWTASPIMASTSANAGSHNPHGWPPEPAPPLVSMFRSNSFVCLTKMITILGLDISVVKPCPSNVMTLNHWHARMFNSTYWITYFRIKMLSLPAQYPEYRQESPSPIYMSLPCTIQVNVPKFSRTKWWIHLHLPLNLRKYLFSRTLDVSTPRWPVSLSTLPNCRVFSQIS